MDTISSAQTFLIKRRLRTPGKLGDELSFIPKSPLRFQLNPFGRNPVAESLIIRVDRLRNNVRNQA